MPWWSWLFWCLAAALALSGVGVAARAMLADRARGRRRCPRCWYDMSGTDSLLCPECGREARSAGRLLRTRRRPWRAAAGVAILVPAYAAFVAPYAMTRGWWNSIPTPALIIILQFYDGAGEAVFQNVESRLAAPNASVSDWEKLLVARHCGKMLRDTAVPAAAAAAVPDRPPVNLSDEEQAELRAMAAPAGGGRAVFGVSNSSPRYRALAMLQKLGPHVRPAVPALVKLLDDADSYSVFQSTQILGRAGDSRPAIDALTRALSNENYHYRSAAAHALGEVGPPAASAIPALSAAVGRAKDSIGSTGVSAMVKFGGQSVPALMAILDDPRPSLRYIATDALKKLGPEAGTPAVLAALARRRSTDENATVRLGAVITAGAIGGGRATPILAEALSDPYAMVRYWAAKHLHRIGPAGVGALPALREALARSGDEEKEQYIREAIAAAIGAVEGG